MGNRQPFEPLRSLVAALLACCAFAVYAQDFPSKPIRIYVGNTPGQPPDILARALAPALQKSLGQPVVVENRPGGGGLVSFEFVATQVPPDGHGLVIGGTGLAIFPVFMKDLRFDPLKDIVPVSMLVEGAIHLSSPAAAPWNNFNEMIAYARANPGKLNFGSTGPQTLLALLGEILNQKFGVKLVEVPYKGGNIEGSVMANEVQLGFLALFQVRPAGNRLKILAITGSKRSPEFPSIPTVAEVGVPEISGFWTMLGAPKGTPRPIIDRLYGVVASTLQQAETREQMEKLGLQVLAENPDATARKIASASAVFAATAKRAGIGAK